MLLKGIFKAFPAANVAAARVTRFSLIIERQRARQAPLQVKLQRALAPWICVSPGAPRIMLMRSLCMSSLVASIGWQMDVDFQEASQARPEERGKIMTNLKRQFTYDNVILHGGVPAYAS